MRIKALLMPMITERRFSRATLEASRARHEKKRQQAGRPHQVHYFHQVDDPYSHLVVQALPAFMARYKLELVPHLVSPPPDSAAPEREKLVAYSRVDAALLARKHGLSFIDPGQQPSHEHCQAAAQAMLHAIQSGQFVGQAAELSRQLWSGGQFESAGAEVNSLNAHVAQSDALREKLGHYLGGMLYYEGEWYWGIDRLYHLENRLQALGVQQANCNGVLFPFDDGLFQAKHGATSVEIDFFFSFRSPYSAIVAPRVFELGRLTGAKVNLRFVLPMVMRGLPVPKVKREYIVRDTAREAHARGLPFGRLNDPVGRPTERGLALIPFAEQHNKGQEFVLSYMQGVWAEGIDAGSDRGLKKIVERAGLRWEGAQIALMHTAWRDRAAANREALFAAGLWGVPSFKVGELAVWGQDRLWAVRNALGEHQQSD